jgi:flagellar hook-associated protein 1 FlgK
MSPIFATLGIGYSALNAAQIGVETTSHNISNAENEGYTRQKVIQSAATPLNTSGVINGNGVHVTDVKRVFDNFVFTRFREIAGDKEYADFTETTLKELSTYFPEIENVGIKYNLSQYYKMQQNLADNPDSDPVKLALTKQTEILTNSIVDTQNKIVDMQQRLNDQLKVNVDEVNTLAEQIAKLNVSISNTEASSGSTANDLRDKRNLIEKNLSRLIGAKVSVGKVESDINVHSRENKAIDSYTLNVGTYTIVDGRNFHPLKINNDTSISGLYSLSYERQDGVLIPMDEDIRGGKVGAILELRGSKISRENVGSFENGVLQNVINELDAFSKGLIQNTNNLYAAAATTNMESNSLNIGDDTSLVTSDVGIKEGAFDIIIYDIDGDEKARRTININAITSMTGANSIESQINADADDNDDGSASNDVDDYVQFSWVKNRNGEHTVELHVDPSHAAKGYTFAVEDKLKTSEYNSGSNFAGAVGLSRIFDGSDAHDIRLNYDLKNNPTHINAGKSSATADNEVALSIVQQQFEKYDFDVGKTSHNITLHSMFDVLATDVGIKTNAAVLANETITAQFKAVELEYSTVSKVSIDEEMTNLIKYQTSYGAASKIITTIDQMMQTLLGIKQ